MEVKYLPSFANDFPYIVVWDKEKNGEYSLYSVCDSMSEAEADAETVRDLGFKFLIIFNNLV